MDVSQYKDLFITEAQEHLDAMNRSLLELEQRPSGTDAVTEIFRSAHTLKSMSATMGYEHLTRLAHEMEELLEHLRSGDLEVTPDVVEVLFACFDTIGAIVDSIAADSPEQVDYSGLVEEIGRAVERGAAVAGPAAGGGVAPGESLGGAGGEGGRGGAGEREQDGTEQGEPEGVPGGRPDRGEDRPVDEAHEESGVSVDAVREGEGAAEGPLPGAQEAAPAPAPEERAGAAAGEVVEAGNARDEAVNAADATEEHHGTAAFLAGREPLQVADRDVARYSAIPGMRVLRLTVDLDRDCVLKSVRVFMVFKKLAQLGEVLASKPPVEALEEERFERSFEVGYATARMPERVREALLGISEVAWVSVDSIYEPPAGAGEEAVAGGAGREAEKAALALARKTQSIRVNIARLDALMSLVGELVINRTRLAEIASGYDVPELRDALDQTMRLTVELQDEVMKTRMVPVEHVFNRFPRMVRDLARDQGKEIEFVVEGKEIELDRTILDEISEPLIHMIRNAVDHGVEKPGDREARGKPSGAKVKLSAYRDRNYVAVSVEDDGEGMDPAAVFDRAVARGLISEDERRQITAEEVLRVISMPGFSTTESAGDVSGRGVGMDAVKYKAESLGGFVVLDTEPGVGTRVTLMLPLTLAIIQALLVEVSGEAYAIPLGIVRETQVVEPSEIRTIRNHEAVFVREETVPLLRLDRALGCEPPANGTEPFPVVITEIGPRLVAVGAHSLIGQREIVINALERFLKQVEGFAGATILGTGRVSLILDIPGLMKPGRLAPERKDR